MQRQTALVAVGLSVKLRRAKPFDIKKRDASPVAGAIAGIVGEYPGSDRAVATVPDQRRAPHVQEAIAGAVSPRNAGPLVMGEGAACAINGPNVEVHSEANVNALVDVEAIDALAGTAVLSGLAVDLATAR